ncbi:MAG: hypothetical protein PUE95_07495 [Lachnospiraceae bacterium]|nr:hypothetical protein [Lachnospiraceae bacterium]
MVDYNRAWKVRRNQIIVVNIIFAALGITVAILDRDFLEGIGLWFLGSWIIETLVSAFSKSGNRVSTLARDVFATFFSGSFAAASGGGTLWVFFFMFSIIRAMFGTIAITLIIVFEFFAFPFTTIYYYVKSKKCS